MRNLTTIAFAGGAILSIGLQPGFPKLETFLIHPLQRLLKLDPCLGGLTPRARARMARIDLERLGERRAGIAVFPRFEMPFSLKGPAVHRRFTKRQNEH